MVLKLLASPIFFGFGIPVLFLLAGALAKKLVRGPGRWDRSDFFLGIEAALAAMSSALVNIFEIVRVATVATGKVDLPQLLATGGFLAVNFLLLLFLLTIHQEWQVANSRKSNPVNGNEQLFWLGFVSNSIGLSLLGAFIVIVKGLN